MERAAGCVEVGDEARTVSYEPRPMLWPLLRSALFRLDPEDAHRLAHAAFDLVSPAMARLKRPVPPEALAVAD